MTCYTNSELLGRSFFSRMARKAKNAVKTTGRVTARTVKTTERVALKTAKETGHIVATGARAVGHAAMIAERLAKRIIRRAAKKVLLHGDIGMQMLGDGTPIMPKTAATAVLLPAATAAVLASPAAVAAPAVPLLVKEVIDEIYSAITSGKTTNDIGNALDKGNSPFGISKAIWIGGGVVLFSAIGYMALKPSKRH